MPSSMLNRKLVSGAVLAASCAILFLAIAAQAQYDSYDSDSDSNSDSENGPVMSQAELGKLVRNSARSDAGRNNNANLRAYNRQQSAAAGRNLYNKQQPLQIAPTNRRQYGSAAGDLSGYNPMGASSQANNDDDDGEGAGASNFGGANFGANFDSDNDGEQQADGQPMNLNQAASGYPNQGDYAGEGFNFGGASGYGPSAGADFGLGGEGFDGRRAKSASSLMGAQNMGDEDAGAPQFGPNSAVNSGEGDDEGRSGYSPDANDNDNDDE